MNFLSYLDIELNMYYFCILNHYISLPRCSLIKINESYRSFQSFSI